MTDQHDADSKRSFMDIIDGRMARGLWRLLASAMLGYISIISFLGQEARNDIRDLSRVGSDMKAANAILMTSVGDLARRVGKLEDWRNSAPFRGGNP